MTGSLGLGDLYHTGIVVRDLDEAIARFSTELGIDRWGRMEADIPSRYRGHDTVASGRFAYGRAGSTFVELVEPTGGDSTARHWLDTRGEGLYHLGFWADDPAETIRRAEQLGIVTDWIVGGPDGPVAVYFDSLRTFGFHIEIVHASMRPAIEGMVP